MSDQPAGGRLHIDGDWKTEAARDKQRLVEQEAREKPRAGATTENGSATFIELVNLLAMQAAIGLGAMQGSGGESLPPNPIAAKHHIDLLEILRQKTDGNLSDEESRLLLGVLHELRQQYVQVVAALSGSGPVKPGL